MSLLPWVGLVVIVEILRFIKALRFNSILTTLNVPFPTWKVKTSLIVPFRGTEPELEKRIRAFLSQNAGETIFVVDSTDDPVYPILKKFSRRATIIIAAPQKGSGKCAALFAGAKKAEGQVFVFADSDALVPQGWLSSLVNPLKDSHIGATTGYRTYTPAEGWGLLKSVWDEAAIRMMLSTHAFVWGGSFALRKKDFDAWDIGTKWTTAISDDTIVDKAAKGAGKQVRFVPSALVKSDPHTTRGELIEFTNRQMFMVRHFSKRIWYGGLLVYGYSFLVFVTALAILLLSVTDCRYLLPAIVLWAATLLPILNSLLLRRALHLPLKPALLAPDARLLMFYNILRAKTMRRITWRGRSYEV